MFGLNNNVVIFLDNDLVFPNVLDKEGLIVVESVLIDYDGLVLDWNLYLLDTVSSDTVDVLLSMEETLVEGLECVVELYDNLIELELFLNQIWLIKDDDLRVDVV